MDRARGTRRALPVRRQATSSRWLAAFTRDADARCRVIADRPKPEQLAAAVGQADQQQHHTPRLDQGRGAGRDR
ncbi:hypothetical protein ACFWOJ_38040 [Streptomyces sp. NPDC058439]|uniref:hypothetical protein n=1 Tax=Streptomyces sp. NPDC058439 TaxID=3346500 RepID=UPI0036548AD5